MGGLKRLEPFMEDDQLKGFAANLQGFAVECGTVEDAIAIIRADAVLSDREVGTPAELDRLAEVLTRYGQPRFAEAVAHRAVRLRAAEFLLNMTGYEVPK
jgi:hypothetical protein